MSDTDTIKDGQTPTKEQLEEVKATAKREVQFDEDAPNCRPQCSKRFNVPWLNATGGRKTLDALCPARAAAAAARNSGSNRGENMVYY